MLRLVFVILIIIGGAYFAAQGAFYALLFYIWNAYFRPDDWTYGGFIGSLRLSWIIGVYVVIRTIGSLPKPKISIGTFLIWLFFAQAVVGCFTSEHAQNSWNFIQDFGKVLLMTYLIVVLVNDRKQFRLLLWVIAMSLGFEMAKQGWVGTYRAPGAVNNNTIIFLGDNNGVALGAMMLLPILGALAQTSTQWYAKSICRFVAIGVFLRGITTYSRGGFLGAGALAGVTLLRSERKIRAAIVIAVLGILIYSLMPQSFWDRMNTINVEDESQRDDSSAGRLHFWDVAADMARAKPLTGVGLNGFNKSYLNYNTDDKFDGERAAHSIWFGVLGDLGYPGLILFITNFAWALLLCWRVAWMTRKKPDLRDLKIFANALMSTLVVYCITGSFLSLQYNEMAWHMVGLSTALYLLTLKELAAPQVTTVAKRAA